MSAVEFHASTKAEIRAALRFYRSTDDPELADDFLAKLDDAVRRIVELPRRFPVAHEVDGHEVRRARLRRFPYALLFIDQHEKVVVLAVAHSKRRPLYWVRRLPEREDPSH